MPLSARGNNCITVDNGSSGTGLASQHTSWYGQDIVNEFTVGIWAKGFQAPYWHYLFAWESASLRIKVNEQDLKFVVSQSNTVSSATGSVTITKTNWKSSLCGDKWHYYCCTFKYDQETPANSFQRLYIDGELAAEATGASIVGPPVAPASNRDFTIGGQWHTDGHAEWRTSHGSISEVTIWNKALSADEVAGFNAKRAGGTESGLLIYWPFTGTTADTANAASSGISATLGHSNESGGSWAIAQDDDFPLASIRCVASAEWVSENGYAPSAGATFRTWDDPAATVAAAFAAAVPGDTIQLMPGIHRISEQIDITKANITFTRGPGEGEAVIDAQGLCRHFRSKPDSSPAGVSGFVFDGLTFTNGYETSGGALFFDSKVGEIRNCVFRGNTAYSNSGGAIYSTKANGTVISNCVFAGNSALNTGGAVFTDQNSASDRCFLVDCVVTNNMAKKGGGIYAEKRIAIDGCLFSDNAATAGSSAKDNKGGNVRVGKNATIANTMFTGRCTTPNGGYGSCIALDYGITSVVVTNCTFSGLSSTWTYGLVRLDGNAGITFVDCVFTNNASVAPQLLFPASGASIVVRQCLFGTDAGNTAIISDRQATARFENCTILKASFDAKDNTSAQNVLVNCIIPNAEITSSGNFNNILTNCCVKAGAIPGGSQDYGVIAADPRFVDAANGDYRLSPSSPCREKGMSLGWMTAGSTDLAGEPRLVNLLGKAFADDALPDLGCYECQERGIQPTMIYMR
jgi:predicted outer membrane repeat protein